MDDYSRYICNENWEKTRPEVLKEIRKRIEDGFTIKITQKSELRRDIQNKLAHVWKGQFAKKQHLQNEYVWGAWKYDYLLGIKLANEKLHKEAERERLQIAGVVAVMMKMNEYQHSQNSEVPLISRREQEVEAADLIIRSNELYVNVFSEWLEVIQREAAEAGVVLHSNKEDLSIALYGKRSV